MNPFLFNIILFFLLFLTYKYFIPLMSDETSKKSLQEQVDEANFNPDNLVVNIGGKQVPFNKINKPHHVVLDPHHHKPQVNAESFPDLEPEAKEREAHLEAARAQKEAFKKNE
ncbi:uncharacterized protein RJT20DRAFT_2235 [Scheffersomyces xylosifermentans]|uniref:uncharacterized protein n=1 Tax=Scheffersomyces xylosifermentans TaxID=1304137 RepID=UPI00315D96AB